MAQSRKVDISSYLVIGPENVEGRFLGDVVESAVSAGFTCVQVRSKVCSTRQLIGVTQEAADAIARVSNSDHVKLLVDDRLDVVLAARDAGIKVDGIHVGQSDIPVSVCRKYLGKEPIVGLSARTKDMLDYIKTVEADEIDYLGMGPLHETQTKTDCGLDESGRIITKDFDDLAQLARLSPVPIVVGGGVKLIDIPELVKTGVEGFFVVSAVCSAPDPYKAAKSLVEAWRG